ncbi:MAG: GMC family oxidoreductase [Polyangiaceae bacterium]
MTKLAAIRSSPSVVDGAHATADLVLDADVCVIGTGAGGAVAAATLANKGLSVLMIEEGGYYTHADFTMREKDTEPRLYQEGMSRATADGSIAILQGRAVGGTTVVNWTTCFRTPEDVVLHWKTKHGVGGFGYKDLVPHYDAIEERLAIAKVTYESLNPNNRTLFDGCKKLGWEVETLRRNVYSCMQTGFCHLGCPVNAKRSMLVTMIPDAIDAGAKLVFRARADRFEVEAGVIKTLRGTLLDAEGKKPTGRSFTVKSRRFIVSGGAINSPALLLRSGENSGGLVGTRTFFHPALASVAVYDEVIAPFRGAPQSAASHHHAHRGEEVGFFLEAVPWYPALIGASTPGFGPAHESAFVQSPHTALHIAITIDGFHDDVPGGRITLRKSGAPLIEYPIVPKLWNAFRFAQKRLAEMQFASGAKTVRTLHEIPVVMEGKVDEAAIDAASWEVGSVAVSTAHQMGGCLMGDDPKTSVVRSEDLRHHQITNLHVIDGSVFPTSLGVNPQESIYGLARLMATRIAAK